MSLGGSGSRKSAWQPSRNKYAMSNQLDLLERPQNRTYKSYKTYKSHSPRAATAPKPSNQPDDDQDEESFFKRFRVLIVVGCVVVAGILWAVLGKSEGKSAPARKAPAPMTVVKIQLPPPPPPPKPPPPPPKEVKPVEQAPTVKPDADKPKPAEKPPEGLGTNNKGGKGPGMGLSSRGDGMIGGNGKGRGGDGTRAAWYAGKLQAKIAEAMRNHRKTKNASLRVNVKVWPDASGRVTRAQLDGTTGDASVDAVLKDEILAGIQLPEGPPEGMTMPISLRLTANRPN